MTAVIFGMALPSLLLIAGGWLGFQLVRQNGRILLRLESIERRMTAKPVEPKREPEGLRPGSVAPDFELPDLSGVKHKLAELRGRDVLLIFFNPKCGFCERMASSLAALPVEGSNGRAVPIVVSTGSPEDNRKLVEEHGVRCLVLLQNEMEVAAQFRARGTPMGYGLDRDGLIVTPLVVGAEKLLELAERPLAAAPRERVGDPPDPKDKRPDPSLARSRINRSGLKAGTAAPLFSLPRIDGGELALQDLHGRKVLLVFSDPDCGPCDELAPHLQELHVTRPDLQVLVISRRDPDATRNKAETLGLTYPIVMQKQWELSLKYGMFATPIGYLIDEQGLLLSDVTVGIGPILELARQCDRLASDSEPALRLNEPLLAAT